MLAFSAHPTGDLFGACSSHFFTLTSFTVAVVQGGLFAAMSTEVESGQKTEIIDKAQRPPLVSWKNPYNMEVRIFLYWFTSYVNPWIYHIFILNAA
ncbi:hypothetical protein EOD39_12267 [Acipenser ruthenus]|uniref:Uncharacterized protein n=1 Tax=Acipenser ruthenus TaxID=7906 RepID=A0A444ULS2_ACIRT|nr:hypothetical protein EOD39_12267 [Acipenser ruthenus]